MKTVAELIAELQKLPQDAVVVQSSDAEGNGYSPVLQAAIGRYAAETTHHGEFGLDELTPEDIAAGYSDEDVVDGPLAVCLYPVS